MHAKLQESLRAALRGRRDVQSIGPFPAAFDPDSDSPFRNYAVPEHDARPTREEVASLRRAFVRRARLPRLEFLPAATPAVEGALIEAGFVTEARLPIMTCSPWELREAPAPRGVSVEVAVGDGALREAAEVQNAAYGAPRATEADVVRLERAVAAGAIVGLARHGDGRAIGSGLIAAASEGFAELAAVGVLAGWRRRGVAGALTGALCRVAFDRGVAALMLMAYAAEQGIYARAGFTVSSEIIFISAP
jgi:ribosomal protein S18 acetylase RimI-like enzyme